MKSALNLSLFILWSIVSILLIGNFLAHFLIYALDGSFEKFLSPIWFGLILVTGLVVGLGIKLRKGLDF